MKWARACVVLALACIGLQTAHALKFKALQDGKVLLVYDCGSVGLQDETKDTCKDYESSFYGPSDKSGYPGDSVVLERMLSRSNGFSQIWLVSGGGDLDEGVKVGELLRRYNSYVVVPPKGHCVSACTVAFLGGRLRDVDPEASYEVHAYSSYSQAAAAQFKSLSEEDGEFALEAHTKRIARGAPSWASRLHAYAQRMIGGRPDGAALARVMATAPDFYSQYVKTGGFRADLDRIRKEGPVSAQEILMRVERDAFGSQLDHIAAHVNELGPRASPAVDILRIMFASRITGTYALDQTTLREKGYINVRR